MTYTDDIINSRNINDLLNEFAKQYSPWSRAISANILHFVLDSTYEFL